MRHEGKNHLELGRARAARWYEKNKKRSLRNQRKAHLNTYGLTEDQFNKMVADREGRCDLCHRVPDYVLRIDHDHETGKVRGLLCASCNSGLGYLGDTIAGLERAIDYLKKGV